MERVHEWHDICADFRDGLILGNGASIAFDGQFMYESLKREAENQGLITHSVQRVFRYLDTDDFELVMRRIWHASKINDALGIHNPRTYVAYQRVCNALIEVVREIHPHHADVRPHLISAARFMQQFSTVVSLNYDLLVYWAIQLINDRAPNRFKDCFHDGEFEHNWDYL